MGTIVKTTVSIQRLETCKIQELSDILELCKLGDNFFKPTEQQKSFIASEIKKDFKHFTLEDAKDVFVSAIKGGFDDEKKQQNINMRTIYGWFNEYNENLQTKRIIRNNAKKD